MNMLRKGITTHTAAKHARLKVDQKDRIVTATIGLPPGDTAAGSYEHRRAVQAVADTGRVEELREDLRRGEDLQAMVGTPGHYTLGLVITWTVEGAGSLLILRSLGVPPEHRELPALALTAAMIGLTKATVAATAAAPASPPSAPPAPPSGADSDDPAPLPASVPIQWKRYLLPLVYGCLVAAVAAARVMGSNADDVPPAAALAEAVILIAITCGPAFAAVWLEEKRAPAKELAHQIALVRRRLRAEEKRIKQAERYLLKLDRAQRRWVQDDASIRMTYAMAHEVATAEERLNAEDPDSSDDVSLTTTDR